MFYNSTVGDMEFAECVKRYIKRIAEAQEEANELQREYNKLLSEIAAQLSGKDKSDSNDSECRLTPYMGSIYNGGATD